MASQGDPVYMSTMERYTENPSEWTYDSLAEGFDFVMRGQHVIKMTERMLFNYVKSNATLPELYFFGKTRTEVMGLLFHLNSPLVPMFEQGTNFLKENGIEDELYKKWLGLSNSVTTSNPEQGTAFNLGQMVLLLVSISALYAFTLIVFCIELVVQRFMKHVKQRSSRTKREVNISKQYWYSLLTN